MSATRPRILHLCKVYLPIRGGVQKVVHLIARLTDQYAHQVLTTGEDGAVKNQKIDDIDITRCRSYLEIASMPIAPTMVIKARKKTKEVDIVCVHFPFPLADLSLMFTLRRPPIIVFWHSNIVAQRKLKWVTYPLVLLTLWRASRIVVTSRKMIDNSSLLQQFSKKVETIPYGLPEFDKSIRFKSKTRDCFLLIGRHVSYKGMEIAIKAMRNVEVGLVIVGDGPLFEKHKLLADTLEIQDKIKFEKNASDEQVSKLIHDCIGLIVPSILHNEAFALVQLEAMRQKRPIINTRLPSTVPTVARDQQEGLTVEPNDPEALSDAMNKLACDPELANKLGNRGYSRFKSHYTDAHYKHALDSLFHDVLG